MPLWIVFGPGFDSQRLHQFHTAPLTSAICHLGIEFYRKERRNEGEKTSSFAVTAHVPRDLACAPCFETFFSTLAALHRLPTLTVARSERKGEQYVLTSCEMLPARNHDRASAKVRYAKRPGAWNERLCAWKDGSRYRKKIFSPSFLLSFR